MIDVPDYIVEEVSKIRSKNLRVVMVLISKLMERQLHKYAPEVDLDQWPGGKEEYARALVRDIISDGHKMAVQLSKEDRERLTK